MDVNPTITPPRAGPRKPEFVLIQELEFISFNAPDRKDQVFASALLLLIEKVKRNEPDAR